MAQKWALLVSTIIVFGCNRGNPEDKPAIEVKPGQSIQAAIEAAKPGDTVLIRPGTYRPSASGEAMIVLKAEKNGVVLRGAGKSADEVVIDGNSQVLHVVFFDKGIDRSTVLENLTVTGGCAFPGKLLPPNYTPVLRPEMDGLDNDFYHDGAGLMLFLSSPTIRNCRIIANRAQRCGGGISVFCPSEETFPAQGPLIFGNEIVSNTVDEGTGGGIDVYYHAKADIVNNLLAGNKGWGGAVAVLDHGSATLNFNTITGNDGSVCAVAIHGAATLQMSNTILAGNVGDGLLELPGKATYTHCCFWGNAAHWDAPPDKGHVLADPLFVDGPHGKYYLSQPPARQAATSPCVDAGSGPAPSSDVSGLSTRTDGGKDTGQADMGYHRAGTP